MKIKCKTCGSQEKIDNKVLFKSLFFKIQIIVLIFIVIAGIYTLTVEYPTYDLQKRCKQMIADEGLTVCTSGQFGQQEIDIEQLNK